jgi:glucose/arabinose dehydrogenase
VLLEVSRKGRIRELAEGKLSQPGGVVVAKDGAVFVTDNVFTEFGGRLLRVRT